MLLLFILLYLGIITAEGFFSCKNNYSHSYIHIMVIQIWAKKGVGFIEVTEGVRYC